MAVATSRPTPRGAEVRNPVTVPDSRFARLTYLHGWWYGSGDLLGFRGVRLRLPGDLGGPASAAREAILALDNDGGTSARHIEPDLWACYLAARVNPGRRVRRARRGEILREHYRLDAVCVEAIGAELVVELAFEARWAPGHFVGASIGPGGATHVRRSINVWRTPE